MNLSPQRVSQLVDGGEQTTEGDQLSLEQATDKESSVEEEEEEEEVFEEQETQDRKFLTHQRGISSFHGPMMLVQDLSRSHDLKYRVLFENLEALMTETKILKFLEKFTEINEFLNAYLGHLDAQTSQLRRIENPAIYARLSN